MFARVWSFIYDWFHTPEGDFDWYIAIAAVFGLVTGWFLGGVLF